MKDNFFWNTNETPVGKIPSNWKVSRVKDLTEKVGSGATPTGGSEVYLQQRRKYALIRSQNVFDRHFDEEGLAYISDEHARQLQNAEVFANDILLNITGDGVTFGRACLAPAHQLPACVNQHVAIIRTAPHLCVPGFLLSYLTHPLIKHYIESFNAGGSRRAVTKGHIESFVIPLPPLLEQRAIADILGSLDDKIELNRRLNATLEEMARAIFQSWFVDFDPVRAKAAGRAPAGLDAATAALFPHAFEVIDGREVPRGWEWDSFVKLINLIGGGTPKTSEPAYWDGNIPWFSVVDAPNESDVFVIDTRKKITELGLSQSSTNILPIGTTIISARGTVGKCALVGIPMAMNQSCYGITGTDQRGSYFTYFAVRQLVAELQRVTHGAVFDTITRDTFKVIKTPVFPPQITVAFDKQISGLFKQILSNLYQSRTLIELRDALLPRLISGELRVRDAERLVEDTL